MVFPPINEAYEQDDFHHREAAHQVLSLINLKSLSVGGKWGKARIFLDDFEIFPAAGNRLTSGRQRQRI